MSNPWTPGPWVASCADVVGERPLGDSGLRFWNIEPSGGPHEKYRGMVACAYSAEHIGGITVDERNANARLIAAAPEMFEALQDLLEDTQRAERNCGDPDCPVAAARALLARIRGEAA